MHYHLSEHHLACELVHILKTLTSPHSFTHLFTSYRYFFKGDECFLWGNEYFIGYVTNISPEVTDLVFVVKNISSEVANIFLRQRIFSPISVMKIIYLKTNLPLHFYFPPKAGKYINGVVCLSVCVSVPKNYEGSQRLCFVFFRT